jgi:ADP-heptose:LPS heptosyltransferase
MSLTRSTKDRFRQLFETHVLLRPVGGLARLLLAQNFKFQGFLQRLWILVRLINIRVQGGKKLIVIYRGIGIGDIVCTFPLLEEIRKQYPDHQVVYVTSRQSRDFVAKFSAADAVISTTYSLFSQPLPRIPSWVATKAHFPIYKGEKTGDYSGDRQGYILEMASSFGIALSQPRLVIEVDHAAADASLHRFSADKSPRPFIGIHLGPTMPVREYPIDSWRELAARLHLELGATIFRFGSKVHHSFDGFDENDRVNVQFDFADRLDLVESTQLLSTMNLFIGIDSGLLHIANAAGVPVIGLFGPTDPALVLSQTPGVGLFSKEMPCIFCQHRQLNLHWNTGCPFDIQCMKLISVDSILAEAKSILEAAGLLSIRAT